jgi:hypothetical protein
MKKENGGLPSVRNVGLREANGKYLPTFEKSLLLFVQDNLK